jgi:tRNA threonylcarbamoyladenosine biosynthesis protein TsaE
MNLTINKLVKEIINLIPKYKIFILNGILGAGKTTLVKKIAKKLKIKENLISPTFILWQKYSLKIKNKNYFLNHIDLYRVNVKDILKLNFLKEIKNKKNIFFIEWGEKLKSLFKKRKIKYIEIIIKKNGSKRTYFLIK